MIPKTRRTDGRHRGRWAIAGLLALLLALALLLLLRGPASDPGPVVRSSTVIEAPVRASDDEVPAPLETAMPPAAIDAGGHDAEPLIVEPTTPAGSGEGATADVEAAEPAPAARPLLPWIRDARELDDLEACGLGPGAQLGSSLATRPTANGTLVAVGAPGHQEEAGAVLLLRLDHEGGVQTCRLVGEGLAGPEWQFGAAVAFLASAPEEPERTTLVVNAWNSFGSSDELWLLDLDDDLAVRESRFLSGTTIPHFVVFARPLASITLYKDPLLIVGGSRMCSSGGFAMLHPRRDEDEATWVCAESIVGWTPSFRNESFGESVVVRGNHAGGAWSLYCAESDFFAEDGAVGALWLVEMDGDVAESAARVTTPSGASLAPFFYPAPYGSTAAPAVSGNVLALGFSSVSQVWLAAMDSSGAVALEHERLPLDQVLGGWLEWGDQLGASLEWLTPATSDEPLLLVGAPGHDGTLHERAPERGTVWLVRLRHE